MKNKFLLSSILVIISFTLYAQQADWSMVPYRSGDKWGYASPDNKVVIQPKFDEVGWFYEGYAVAKKGGKYGYINKAGKVVVPFKFYSAKPFRFGYVENKAKNKSDTVLFAGAAPKADGFEICINTKGTRLQICPAINENTDSVNISKTPLETKETVYTLSAPGGLYDKIISDYTITGNADNFYIAQKNGLYGIFNNKFEVLLPFEYNSLERMNINNEVYLIGKKNGVSGIFKGNGMVLMPVEYSTLRHVRGNNNDYFIVSKDGKSTIKNINNNDIIPAQYASIMYDDNGGFVISDANNNRGFYFMNNTMVQPKYADVKLLNKNGKYLFVTTKTGKKGYVGANGIEYFEE